MGKYRRLVIASMAGFLFQKTIAQDNYVILEKNRNFRANDLIHELNSNRDSLILRGSEKIKYVYSINSEYQREIDTYAGSHNYKVALSDLSPGKHVLVVSHKQKLVVFVLKKYRNELELIASRETDVVARKR